MHGGESMSGDTVEIFFTVEPIVDVVLTGNDIPPPVIKFLASQSCNLPQDELFVKVTKNRKESKQWN